MLNLEVPHAGPVFLAALALHVLAGLTGVISGALAASARKRPGRHPRAGRVYLWAIATVFLTASIMAVIRWPEDRHLLAIAVVAAGLAGWGWRSRVRRARGWARWHAIGVGGSYIALLTGFYVDNGPRLPLWDGLPHWTYWVLPAAIGIPLIVLALRRFHSGVSQRPHTHGRPGSRGGRAARSSRWPRPRQRQHVSDHRRSRTTGIRFASSAPDEQG